ncbi:MAG: EamA family transporter [Mesorhizobium sp.]
MIAQQETSTLEKTNPALEVGLLLLLSLIWGSSFTLIKVAVEAVPPLTMVAARVTIAAGLLLCLARMRGFTLPRGGAVWSALVVQGLLQSALPFTLISWGEKHVSSGLAGVLNATPPMFVLLIGITTAKGRRRIDVTKIVGVVLGFAGVLLTVGPGALGSMGATTPFAQFAVLGASLCYALAAMWGHRFSNLPAIVTAGGAMACASALILPAAIVVDRPWTLSPSRSQILAVLALAIVCTAFAMVIYFRLVRTLGALGTTSGSYLRAGFAVLLGIVFLDESFTWEAVAGMTMVVLGVIAVTAPRAKASTARQVA